MNKYQEALDRIALNYGLSALDESNEIMDSKFSYDISLMIELVDKETPMTPLHISLLTNPPKNIIVCGNCKLEITKVHKYCSECGQKIDWGD